MVDKFGNKEVSLFKENEVDNLHNLIYGKVDDNQEEDDYMRVDSNRYDINKNKLDFYLIKIVKKTLKSKFVTG